MESRHDPVLKNDFRIIGKGYRNNTSRRKIAEALFVKKMKPSLNIHEKSVKLELFNERLFQKQFLVKAFVIFVDVDKMTEPRHKKQGMLKGFHQLSSVSST